MKSPLVSVIVPNYNHARYLNQRLDSILAQSFPDFELIFLDDASTDNSRDIFVKYQSDPRVRAIFNDINSGSPFAQWNRGVREASGRYVWIAESDDFAGPNLLSLLLAALDDHPSAGLAYCQSSIVDERGGILASVAESTDFVNSQHWRKDFFNNGREECVNYLAFQNTIPNASAVLFRRAVFEQVGGAEMDWKLCADWQLWIKMLLVSDIVFRSAEVNYFRKHPLSVREAFFENDVGLREHYRIVAFLSRKTQVPAQTLIKLKRLLARRWLRLIKHKLSDFSLAINLSIYREAKTFDRAVILRLPVTAAAKLVDRVCNTLAPKKTAKTNAS